MQLAECTPEISFDVIEKELQIKSDEVESFLIDGKHCFWVILFLLYYI